MPQFFLLCRYFILQPIFFSYSYTSCSSSPLTVVRFPFIIFVLHHLHFLNLCSCLIFNSNLFLLYQYKFQPSCCIPFVLFILFVYLFILKAAYSQPLSLLQLIHTFYKRLIGNKKNPCVFVTTNVTNVVKWQDRPKRINYIFINLSKTNSLMRGIVV